MSRFNDKTIKFDDFYMEEEGCDAKKFVYDICETLNKIDDLYKKTGNERYKKLRDDLTPVSFEEK